MGGIPLHQCLCNHVGLVSDPPQGIHVGNNRNGAVLIRVRAGHGSGYDTRLSGEHNRTMQFQHARNPIPALTAHATAATITTGQTVAAASATTAGTAGTRNDTQPQNRAARITAGCPRQPLST